MLSSLNDSHCLFTSHCWIYPWNALVGSMAYNAMHSSRRLPVSHRNLLSSLYALMMATAVGVSEMSTHFCETTRHYIPEEGVFVVTTGRTSDLTCMKQSTTSVSVIAVRLSERIDMMQAKDWNASVLCLFCKVYLISGVVHFCCKYVYVLVLNLSLLLHMIHTLNDNIFALVFCAK